MSDSDEEWANDIDQRLDNLDVLVLANGKQIKIALGVSVGAGVLAIFANYAVGKIAKMLAPMGQAIGNHDKALEAIFNPPKSAHTYVDRSTVARHLASDDETRAPAYDMDVAEPVVGPESRVSDRVREALEAEGDLPSHAFREDFET